MRTIVTIGILHLVLCLHAQEFAGEDKESCGDPVQLGIPNPNPEHCYLWEVGFGLSNADKHNPNPIVSPSEDATYRVTVTDQNFSFKATDEVHVTQTLGRIDVEPEYVRLAEDPEPVQARLVTADGSETIVIWSISDRFEAEGCIIGPDGIISGCLTDGRITVRATDADNMNCYVELDVQVNNGVQEIEIAEMSNLKRIARSTSEVEDGDVLRITDIDQVRVLAFPNPGSEFPAGEPIWEGSPQPDEQGVIQWFIEPSDVEVGNGYSIFAGDQSVSLVFQDEDDVPAYTGDPMPHLIEAINPFLSQFFGLGSFLASGPCTCDPTPTQHGVEFLVSRKWAERYDDPGLGRYIGLHANVAKFFSIDFGGGTSCAYLERFGREISFPDVPGHVYIAPFLVFGNNAQELKYFSSIIFDPSDERFTFQNPVSGFQTIESEIFGEISYAAGIAVVESLTDGPFGLESANLTPESEFKIQNGIAQLGETIEGSTVDYAYEWGGLQLNRAGSKLYYGSPSNPTWTKMGRGALNLMNGGQGSVTLPLMPPGIFTFE